MDRTALANGAMDQAGLTGHLAQTHDLTLTEAQDALQDWMSTLRTPSNAGTDRRADAA